ncbi:hypothetical protein Forpi1262_v016904 [Fusarium oxysporum f. sp. raphani]|nr:hypothetical protein Forpi1262_v016904 [Fusarium oxysporum f. sp. raphani]
MVRKPDHQILDQFDFNATSQMREYNEVAYWADFPADDTAEPIVPFASINYPFYDMLGGMENDPSLSPSTAFQTNHVQLGDHYVASFNHDEEEASSLLTPPNSDPPQTMQRHRLLTPNAMSPLSATNMDSTTIGTALPSGNTFNSPMGGIDPALLVASSSGSGSDSLTFIPLPKHSPAEAAAFEWRSWTTLGVTIGPTSLKAVDTTKASDLTVAESPIYTRHRHGICRCLSGYCGMNPRAQSGPVARSVPRGDSEHELCSAAAA